MRFDTRSAVHLPDWAGKWTDCAVVSSKRKPAKRTHRFIGQTDWPAYRGQAATRWATPSENL